MNSQKINATIISSVLNFMIEKGIEKFTRLKFENGVLKIGNDDCTFTYRMDGGKSSFEIHKTELGEFEAKLQAAREAT